MAKSDEFKYKEILHPGGTGKDLRIPIYVYKTFP